MHVPSCCCSEHEYRRPTSTHWTQTEAQAFKCNTRTELHSVLLHGLISLLQVSMALQKDGTVAVQTALDKALVQWPFLHDTSLVAATAAVFMPAASHSHDAARSAAQAAAASALDVTLLQPWLYNNVLLLNSQLFIPVLDKVRTVPLSLCSLGSE